MATQAARPALATSGHRLTARPSALSGTLRLGFKNILQVESLRAKAKRPAKLLNMSRQQLVTKAEYLWSMDPVGYEEAKSKELCGGQQSLHLTEMIDKKRPGPNKTGAIVIGSDPQQVDLAIKHPAISATQAEIEEDGESGHLFVSDLDSPKGTYLNGKKVGVRTRILPGDRLSFGDHEESGVSPATFVLQRNVFAHA
mmetsp:Transcript_9141/g.26208  ORF Transcript_9141/g.26208 Transcript_9141/m.26208 type:complete len:198 (+) Transcript_9141:217-810(+)|eukprot:CAMPEP_0117659396 /NCGR_PEP_ID=MMETSP0804-20121206/6411_1 /TAXON_ID=1074897 /ORGANISM="Tetraselmis astigmatica, Strain CCMP880" /LENGTH=197 /DNA_ID=CAMNT_0005466053 /DNA_START=451 /DNA_END=1044 /DNA_ORIENTATION=-